MPYAAEGIVSESPLEGGIEITRDQYQEALAGIRRGLVVTVKSGFDVVPPAIPEEPEPSPPTLTELADQKRAEIDVACYAAFAEGVAYTFGDVTDYIQIRPGDKANLLAIREEAKELVASGESAAVLEFRARSNRSYNMTPDEVIQMTRKAFSEGEKIYKKSWALKDEIQEYLDAADREGVESVTW